ncbi:MAG: LysR family transcriptional regulator [Woeseia sp.]
MKSDKHIDFSALRIFAAVADADTLTQAAENLGITQSAVSQAIQQIEAQVGSELVIRRSRPVKLTAGGKVFRDYAVRTLADMARVRSDIQLASDATVLQLNIGMIDSFAEVASGQIMERIKPFASKLTIRTGISGPLTDAFLKRDLDILVTGEPLENHAELDRYPILRDPFVMIIPERFSNERNRSPQWLAENVPFVHYCRQNRIGMLVDLVARRLGIDLMTHYELDSTQTLLRFVQAGHGWSIVTGLCLIRHAELLRGTEVMSLSGGANARQITLLSHRGELGGLPAMLARICQDIYRNDLVPKLTRIAPWFGEQAYTIDELQVM